MELWRSQQAPVLAGTAEGTMAKQALSAICFAAVVLLLTTSVFVVGLPILGPDLTVCKPVILQGGIAPADTVDCCFVETHSPIKDFKFNLDLPMRVRRPVHKVNDEFVRKYERAVELMKALPPEDPRSFVAQANFHCAHCGDAYNQYNTSVTLSVHGNWFFFPFHRWYVYFYERILGSLIGDDTFAIPYWAWDVQGDPRANSIPSMYSNRNSSLYDERRSKAHQPPQRADLENYGLRAVGPNKDPDVLLQDNLYNMWRTMIGDVQTPEAFFGGKVSKGEDVQIMGVMEAGPHAAVHTWTGDETTSSFDDMGSVYGGGRDPIFFSHHSQVDRLWLMWKSLGGKDYDDPDWLDSEFLFYDENADLVRVNVRDVLNVENLRVTYEQVEAEWLNYTPGSIRDIDPKYRHAGILRRIWRQVVGGQTYRTIALALGWYSRPERNEAKVSLGGVRRAAATWRVSRPEVLRSRDDSSVYDEVLVITGVVEKPFNVNVFVHIFLELPEADENTPRHCAEFLGSVKAQAEGLDVGMNPIVARKFTKTIGIGDRLKILNIIRQKSVTVTFVPAWDPKHDSEVSIRDTELKVETKLAR